MTSSHVLLNLKNSLEKSDEMQGLPRISSLFCDKFNKFNNTRAHFRFYLSYAMLRLV